LVSDTKLVILNSMGIEELLRESRKNVKRLTPYETDRALTLGAFLVDIRSDAQRARDGTVPAARFIPRNMLESRLDPRSRSRDPELAHAAAPIIVMCDEGYQSGLAAAMLQALGLSEATDLVGGFQAWRAAGFPVEPQAHTQGDRTVSGAVFRVHGH
jgi:rhodanese-related sulfurtransferase